MPTLESHPVRPSARTIPLFFVLALGITWLLQAPALLAQRGVIEGPMERYLLPAALGGFGPVLAAVLAARHESGAGGVRELFRRLSTRAGALWYLHCADGFDSAVGEDYATFQEDRAATFQAFIDRAPAEFKPLAQPPHAPYRIVEPGAAGFNLGGPHEHYYDSIIDEIWSANGITIPKAGPNGSGLGAYPDLSAAIFRHVGNVAGSFDAAGKLLNKNLWRDSSTFYQAAPANYYARFWHERAIDGKAYGFPYDDVGGYSSYISHRGPDYLLVAIGW